MLAELEAAEAELAAADGDVRGSVRLAAFPTAAATLVPRAMAAFAARHPRAEVLLSELEPEDALPALKLGEADVAVIHEYDFSPRGDDTSIELTPLAEDEIHVAVPAEHPAAGTPGWRPCSRRCATPPVMRSAPARKPFSGQSFSTSTAPVDIGCTLRW